MPTVCVAANGTKLRTKLIVFQIIFSNKTTNQMQQFLKSITWRLYAAQHVSGILTPTIRSSTTAVAASGFTVGAWW